MRLLSLSLRRMEAKPRVSPLPPVAVVGACVPVALAIMALLALIGCRTPGEFEISFEMERNEYGEGFDRLVRLSGA